jgi:predicted nucleotide-binding protein (sugar kinase/HSP70/actin superfamily)
MNSKVKQYLREGASVDDIAAGLSYSVAKNCLNKVLKIKNMDELGDCIVVQGGTMRNHSVIKAFETITGKELLFTDIPELMGAYGAALYAKQMALGANHQGKKTSIHAIVNTSVMEPEMVLCTGCENQCMVRKFSIENGTAYYSGNKCEKIFNNKGTNEVKGTDLHLYKYETLFSKLPTQNIQQPITIGIPRILNMYENFPFWNALLVGCGFKTVLSHRSTYKQYEKGIATVMSDNICFPAKLVHGHIFDLASQKVDRIFMPYVVFEKKDETTVNNSYNCPIVSGYSDVIKNSINTVSRFGIPIDAPAIVFNDDKLLKAACFRYLKSLNIKKTVFEKAFNDATNTQLRYTESLYQKAQEIVTNATGTHRIVILLAGHPYHNDPLIQHKISEIICDLGADVITEDIVRFDEALQYHDVHAVLQWTYTNRIIKAAKWVTRQPANVHFVQITSFGCGPDAFIIDEITDILRRNHRPYTQLKVDDINNTGSLRLRIRSLIESLKFKTRIEKVETDIIKKNRVFTHDDKNKIIIGPFFSEYYSPFLPPLLKQMGYNMINLPPGNQQSIELGLQYSNNEVCYPATLIIGDILQALKSGNYDLENTAVMFAQTGGQCRATNYISILKKAMINAGYADIPVVSMGCGSRVINDQPGFELNWSKNIGLALKALLFADCISQMYYSTVVREKTKGQSVLLRNFYIGKAVEVIEARNPKRLFALLEDAAEQFNGLAADVNNIPTIGIVGEIYLKHNSFSNRHLYQWLIEQGVEVIAPSLANFFLQYFVNSKVNQEQLIERSSMSPIISDLIHQLVKRLYRKMDKASAKFRYYKPFSDINEEAQHASQMVNLAAQFGEGWLIPAEISGFAQNGVDAVVCLQPFGCISNHVIAKGISKKVATLYPNLNLLYLDFDGGTSEVNILNRLHFVIQNISKKTKATELDAVN